MQSFFSAIPTSLQECQKEQPMQYLLQQGYFYSCHTQSPGLYPMPAYAPQVWPIQASYFPAAMPVHQPRLANGGVWLDKYSMYRAMPPYANSAHNICGFDVRARSSAVKTGYEIMHKNEYKSNEVYKYLTKTLYYPSDLAEKFVKDLQFKDWQAFLDSCYADIQDKLQGTKLQKVKIYRMWQNAKHAIDKEDGDRWNPNLDTVSQVSEKELQMFLIHKGGLNPEVVDELIDSCHIESIDDFKLVQEEDLKNCDFEEKEKQHILKRLQELQEALETGPTTAKNPSLQENDANCLQDNDMVQVVHLPGKKYNMQIGQINCKTILRTNPPQIFWHVVFKNQYFGFAMIPQKNLTFVSRR